MVLKQPKRDKRTDTYKGNVSPKTVLVLLLFLSKNKQLKIVSCKVKKTVANNIKNRIANIYAFIF